MRTCQECQSLFTCENWAPTRFCNRSCSAKFNNIRRGPRTAESRNKSSVALRNSPNLKPQPRKVFWPTTYIKWIECVHCDKKGWVESTKRYQYRKTCSEVCAHERRKRNSVKIHTHVYNGVRMDSKWEVTVAQWLDQQSVEWVRPSYLDWKDETGKARKYFPDFYLPTLDVYLDPKNPFLVKTSQDKFKAISSQVDLIWGSPEAIIGELASRIGVEPTYPSFGGTDPHPAAET